MDKISYKLCNIILNMSNRNLFHSKWTTAVKNILIDSGFGHLWINQDNIPMTISMKVNSILLKGKRTHGNILFLIHLNVLIIGFSNRN